MRRLVVGALVVVAIVFLTWCGLVGCDRSEPFAQLELTELRLHARATNTTDPASGSVIVSFTWEGPTTGPCTSVGYGLRVAVGGQEARASTLGGGTWVLDGWVPRSVCSNEAIYVVDGRRLVPGLVAASLGDGRGNPALIAARDLMVPPSVVVESPQPARAGDSAVVAVLPQLMLMKRPAPIVERDGDAVSDVGLAGHRAVFVVPDRWSPTAAGMLRVRAERTAREVRCERPRRERAPVCVAYGLPVDAAVRFAIDTPRE